MKPWIVSFCLLGLSSLSVWAQPSPPLADAGVTVAAPAESPLYLSLGKKAGIGRLMDDFVNRLAADTRLSESFREANLAHLKEQLTEQICEVSGGPCVYKGVDMKTAHEEMNIRRSHFNALVEDLQAAMVAQGIAFRVQNQLLARLAPMHREIIAR